MKKCIIGYIDIFIHTLIHNLILQSKEATSR